MPFDHDPWLWLAIPALGLVAGVVGGMLGVGGSIIMIPGLVWMMGQDRTQGFNQHIYQAAAMIVNLCVCIPAAWQHHKNHAIHFPTLKRILPAAVLFIFLGVMASNLEVFSRQGVGPLWLGRILAIFMLLDVYLNIRKLMARGPATVESAADALQSWPRGSAVGGAMGFQAGLLGVGGGAVAVPLQQILLKLPLRSCIANSAAMICVTAGFGAIFKNMTLHQHGLSTQQSLLLAALLGPTAVVGGLLGGKLTHRLPLKALRVVLIFTMLILAWRQWRG